MELLAIDEIGGLYVDAYTVGGERQLLFLSAWGHDTAIQELLAKLTLSVKEGGLAVLSVCGEESYKRLYIQERELFAKTTGRIGKESIFFGLTHLFVYAGLAKQIDKVNQRALLLKRPEDDIQTFRQLLWQVVRELCPIPLLPEWDNLLTHFEQRQWVRTFSGFNMDAVSVCLNCDELEELITSLIHQRELTIKRPHLKLAYEKGRNVVLH